MAKHAIRKFLHKWGWDTGCRNADVARTIKPFMSRGDRLLDAGCGENGLAGFLPATDITGIDVLKPEGQRPAFTFLQASILSLPFSARSFSVAASVDALEHLPEDLRATALFELLRVADETVVVSFPSGSAARKVDEAFHRNLVERKLPVPEWVTEHLAESYPEVDSVLNLVRAQAKNLGREVETSVFYSERIEVTKFLRWAAIRSRYLYIFSNLLFGSLLPAFLRTDVKNSYRSILLVRFLKM